MKKPISGQVKVLQKPKNYINFSEITTEYDK